MAESSGYRPAGNTCYGFPIAAPSRGWRFENFKALVRSVNPSWNFKVYQRYTVPVPLSGTSLHLPARSCATKRYNDRVGAPDRSWPMIVSRVDPSHRRLRPAESIYRPGAVCPFA